MFSPECNVSDNDFPVLEELVKKIVKEKQPFERLVMKKSDLLEMFKYNEFKIRILNEKVNWILLLEMFLDTLKSL